LDETILGLAKERQIDLIVLGLHSRRPFLHPHSWFHAYRIVGGASCPVLTIRG
jgi:nucleotide-binding universal stress UspA family protein